MNSLSSFHLSLARRAVTSARQELDNQHGGPAPQVTRATGRVLEAVADTMLILPWSTTGPAWSHIDRSRFIADVADLAGGLLPAVPESPGAFEVPVDPDDCYTDCPPECIGECRDPRRLPQPWDLRQAADRVRQDAREVANGDFVHPREAAAHLADLRDAARAYSALTYRDATLRTIDFLDIEVA